MSLSLKLPDGTTLDPASITAIDPQKGALRVSGGGTAPSVLVRAVRVEPVNGQRFLQVRVIPCKTYDAALDLAESLAGERLRLLYPAGEHIPVNVLHPHGATL